MLYPLSYRGGDHLTGQILLRGRAVTTDKGRRLSVANRERRDARGLVSGAVAV